MGINSSISKMMGCRLDAQGLIPGRDDGILLSTTMSITALDPVLLHVQ